MTQRTTVFVNLRTAVSVIILKNNECQLGSMHTYICISCKLSGPGGSILFMYMGSLQIAYL